MNYAQVCIFIEIFFSLQNPWIKVYLKETSMVGKVMVERGRGRDVRYVYTLTAFDGAVGTQCGTYTGNVHYLL